MHDVGGHVAAEGVHDVVLESGHGAREVGERRYGRRMCKNDLVIFCVECFLRPLDVVGGSHT